MVKLTIGADPEVFLRDPKTKKLISAAGLFPGTKQEPFAVMHGAIQVDGMAAEYNIDPCSNANEFVAKNLAVLAQLRDVIKALNHDLKFEFVYNPVADFGAEMIAAQPLENRILGCTPDYNAWLDGAENPIPDADMPFRTASGHIHLGWGSDYDINDPEHIEACCMMAKQLDVSMLGSIFVTEGKDGYERRKLYGKAGAFRPKPYGMEYRSPSNVWLRNTASIQSMFTMAYNAFNRLMNGHQDYENEYYQNIVAMVDKGQHTKVAYDYATLSTYGGKRVEMANLDDLVDYWCARAGIDDPLLNTDINMPKPLIERYVIPAEFQQAIGWNVVNPPVIADVAPWGGIIGAGAAEVIFRDDIDELADEEDDVEIDDDEDEFDWAAEDDMDDVG